MPKLNIAAKAVFILFAFNFLLQPLFAQKKNDGIESKEKKYKQVGKTLYGEASYYAQKFEGRLTANGEIFRHKNLTAACNSLPLGTWIKVTNLKNDKSVIVKTNDRLHKKTKRLIDLTMAAAKQLNFVNAGLAKVRIEILSRQKQAKG